MLERWFKKQKRSLLLGQVVALKRRDFKARYDIDEEVCKSGKMDAWFREIVIKTVDLPCIENERVIPNGAVALDVIIAHHQFGYIAGLDMGDITFPILWRPQLHIVFRLFSIKSGNTLESFEYTEKMSWLRYLKRLFAFRLITLFDRHDIEPLIISSYIKFLKDANKQGFV